MRKGLRRKRSEECFDRQDPGSGPEDGSRHEQFQRWKHREREEK